MADRVRCAGLVLVGLLVVLRRVLVVLVLVLLVVLDLDLRSVVGFRIGPSTLMIVLASVGLSGTPGLD